MSSNKKPEKKCYKFDVWDPGNFEGHLREMIKSQEEAAGKQTPKTKADIYRDKAKRQKEALLRNREECHQGSIASEQRLMEADVSHNINPVPSTSTASHPVSTKKSLNQKKKRETYQKKSKRLQQGIEADGYQLLVTETEKNQKKKKERYSENLKKVVEAHVPHNINLVPSTSTTSPVLPSKEDSESNTGESRLSSSSTETGMKKNQKRKSVEKTEQMKKKRKTE